MFFLLWEIVRKFLRALLVNVAKPRIRRTKMRYEKWMKLVKEITLKCYGGPPPIRGVGLSNILRHPVMFARALTYNLKYF